MLRNLISSGKEITIPEREVTIGGWTGTGFEVINPDDGSGAYIIAGGTNGGVMLAAAIKELWQFLCSFVPSLIISGFSTLPKLPGILLSLLSFATTFSTVWNCPNLSDPNLFFVDAVMLNIINISCFVSFSRRLLRWRIIIYNSIICSGDYSRSIPNIL